MWLLIVLTILNKQPAKTTVSEHPSKVLCVEASKNVVKANYPGHFLTTCVPKPVE